MQYSMLPGRWQCIPPHKGHMELFKTVLKEGNKLCIAVRDTEIDKDNPYTLEERIEALKKAVPDAKIIAIPDIKEICYGRKVGYDIREIKLNEEIESISATKVRNKVGENGNNN